MKALELKVEKKQNAYSEFKTEIDSKVSELSDVSYNLKVDLKKMQEQTQSFSLKFEDIQKM